MKNFPKIFSKQIHFSRGSALFPLPEPWFLLIPHYLHMARILFLTLHKHNSLGKGDLSTSRNLIMSHFNGVPITAISKMAGYEPLFHFHDHSLLLTYWGKWDILVNKYTREGTLIVFFLTQQQTIVGTLQHVTTNYWGHQLEVALKHFWCCWGWKSWVINDFLQATDIPLTQLSITYFHKGSTDTFNKDRTIYFDRLLSLLHIE